MKVKKPLPIFLVLLAIPLVVFAAQACSNGSKATSAPTSATGPSPTLTPSKTSSIPSIPITVRFMAGFKPQADLPFVAAYVAQQKGFFAEQGLDVKISHALQGEHLRLLLSDEIDITTANADSVIRNRSTNGAPIKAIALFGQKSEQAYAVLKNSGINSPKDFEDKTVGYRIAPTPDYLAMLNLTGTDRSKIKEVPVIFDPRLLTEKKVDVYPVFLSNEPFTLKEIGFDVKTFAAADYGVPTLGLTYIVTEDSLRTKRDVLVRFLKATLKGLHYSHEHEDEAIDIVMQYAKGEKRDQQKYLMVSEMQRAITEQTKSNGLGWMTLTQWQQLKESLLQYGAIKTDLETVKLYDDTLIKSIYKNGELIWP